MGETSRTGWRNDQEALKACVVETAAASGRMREALAGMPEVWQGAEPAQGISELSGCLGPPWPPEGPQE